MLAQRARVEASIGSPCCDICAASEVTKSPGGNWMMMKVTIEIAISVGIMKRMRFSI